MLHAKTLQYNLFRLSLWWHPTCPLTSKDVSTSPALLNLVDPRKPLYCIVGRVVPNFFCNIFLFDYVHTIKLQVQKSHQRAEATTM